MENQSDKALKEIKKEFQLERMILFSDAVFAIVITLMAIEIRLPHVEHKRTHDELISALLHLLPTIFAYALSFCFIGMFWYKHLGLFGHLKTFDKGLVVRNLLFLFFVGLFPFSASLLAPAYGLPGYIIYLAVVILCNAAQFVLHYYVLFQRPQLRSQADVTEEKDQLKAAITIGSVLVISCLPAGITYSIISDPDLKPLAALWLLTSMITAIRYTKKKRAKMRLTS